MNYINETRKIITDCYAALKPSEQLRREAAEEQRQGHITEGYARELTKGADAEALQLRQAAGLKLAGLAQQYTDAAKAADMPDGQALQSGDYALLSANFPMSVEEYQKLCERNKNNPTLLRAAIDYGNRNGGIAPYARDIINLPLTASSCLMNLSSAARLCLKRIPPTRPAGMLIGT